MKNNILPGDTVILSPKNGLGRGRFYVLEVDDRDVIHQLYVEGSNGVRWWARAAGALSSRWDEHMAALESGRPVEDRTLFGQGPRRRDPGSAGSGVRAPKTVTVGPGDPATWGGRRPR